MNKITSKNLPDMQKSESGFYNKGIEKVGVRNIITYLPIIMKNGSIQKVLATISSYCSLDANTKGINMSRITRAINKVLKENDNGFKCLEIFVKELVDAHKSPDVYIKAKFKYIMDESSPMSDLYSQKPVDVEIESQFRNNEYKTYLTVETTEMSLCPCSREMSLLSNNLTEEERRILFEMNLPKDLIKKLNLAGFGAHNQRSHINAKVELNRLSSDNLWIEDLYEMMQYSSSCPIFTVLKREDEKYVTEVSYTGGYFDDDHNFNLIDGAGAKFVEDISRDLARHLDSELDKKINDYVVVVNNDESIHPQELKAVSVLTAGRDLK